MRFVFEKRDCIVEGPDYTILSGKQKSWAPDLKIHAFDVAVKTQRRSTANRYGLSWTFQDSSGRQDSILDIPNAWICLVVYDDLKPGYECVVYPLRKIKQLIFEAPRLSKLVGKKQAIYLETLQRQKIF